MRAIVVGAVESTRVALAALARAPGWQVAAVITLPPELASRHSDFVDLAPTAASAGAELIHAADSNAPGITARVAALAPDLAFVIGWSQICRAEFIAAAGGAIIGYHPAPLPRLRGRAVIPWTILQGEAITAGTLFRVDEGLDSGPIIGQRFFHVASDETATTLYAGHMKALAGLMDDALPGLAAGSLPGTPQDERHATWAARRGPRDGRIDWHQPAAVVDRLVRAVTRPYPGAATATTQGPLTVWTTRYWPDGSRHVAAAGQVIERGDDGFAVMCGDGRALFVSGWQGNRPRRHEILGAQA
ncbi:methionyl-tRNA formyltransferase [Polymorphobacter glacialis]|uniref:Methionyl-tRNA formyltransferase n=1 Tax=Sandarakinorhabdus glacialis TaxID=1614636 RepID=A0A917E8H6_9SPHN|nr:methionyl-tRNA formyltransferase [Polymorphobacter glacialis]GGE14528.1 methionyl-tRNA formyltransferase [Polymorphobacter glacialis]